MKLSSLILKKELNKLRKVTGGNIPALNCVLFECFGDKAKLTSGDLEVYLTTEIELIEGGDDKFLVDCKTLADAIKTLPPQPIELVIDDKLVCNYNKGSFVIPIYDSEQYPSVGEVEGGTIHVNDVSRVVLSKSFFADDQLRPVMSGVFFDFENGFIVSTDGHKLYRGEFMKGEGSFICPPKCLQAISSFDSFDVTFNDTNAMFVNGNTRVYSRLIEGNYPNYNSVIPRNNHIACEVNRVDLIEALRRMEVMSSASSGMVRMSFKDNELTLKVEDLDLMTGGSETLDCSCSSSIEIGFKIPFLIQILNSISGDIAYAKLSEPSRASLWNGDNEDVFLLMPMMI